MNNEKPTLISTFAGCGGSSLGYKWAGFKELLAIDFDRNAVKTFKLNFPEIPVWEKDITKLKAVEIMNFCNLKKGELDLLDGSPPCQGFSTLGKRKVNDSRNDLFRDFARLIEDLGPKVFVMENVSGMIKGRMKGKYIEIIKKLKTLDYNVRSAVMDSASYEVPQSRKRLIFIGSRKDLNIKSSFPKPLNKIITAGDALKGANITEDEIKHIEGPRKRFMKFLKPGEHMDKYIYNKYFNTLRLHPRRPSPTIPRLFGTKWGSFFAHWDSDRSITISELKRLCSFPDDFLLTGTFEEQWAVLGNSVMPKFMYHLASHIKNSILNRRYIVENA